MELSHKKIFDDINWLGKVTHIWNVGKYQFFEYKSKDFDTKKVTNKLLYGCYIDGESVRHSYSSLEAIMIHAVCEPSIGPNESPVVVKLVANYIDKQI